ncbi:MAG: histidine kinase [Chitinophagaceae bacterium]|nr:histidine kinase [Chitinophagaceae bacterium]
MYSFVYSNNIRYRLCRHIAFWIAWYCYFITIYSLRPGSSYIGLQSFISYTILEMLILMSVDVIFCYTVVYLLVPRYLIRGKYILFFFFLLVFILLDASVSYFYYLKLINPLRDFFKLPVWTEISFPQLLMGMSGVLMITGSATTIRFLKLWHLKQQEIDLLKSEKLSKEFKFIDTYIQPSFLPLLLKKVYSYSVASSHKVPEMLDRMQKILSYLIDDCNQSTVPISKELDAVKDFLQLEKLTNSGRLTIHYEMNIEPGNKRIVPFILFPLIENNFRQVNDNITDNHWVNIVFRLNDYTLILEIKNSKPVETSNLMNYETANLQQIRKRLELLYPDSHKLNIIIEEESFAIRLEIVLNRSVV